MFNISENFKGQQENTLILITILSVKEQQENTPISNTILSSFEHGSTSNYEVVAKILQLTTFPNFMVKEVAQSSSER